MRRIALVLLLTSLAVALPGARPAAANPYLHFSIMMDDDNLLYRGDSAREAALQRMKYLGVDYVRVTVLWKVVAEHMKKRNRKRADNPKAYPRTAWDRYDNLVRSAKRYNIGIYFDVTGPGPRWTQFTAPKADRKYQRTWSPRMREFFNYVKAVGRRYDGKYRDENADHSVLPRVSFWSIYNEPNQPGHLTPQHRGDIPWSPVLYRDLWYYGRTALDATGHKNDIVLIGETAPLGNTLENTGSPLYPKTFMREFFCRDANDRPYHGRAASERHCDTLKRILPLRYTAWAHHPYTKKASPTSRPSNRNAITMANIGELSELLKRFKVAKEGFAAYDLTASTEYGYETDPPDPFSGLSPKRQADYITTGDYITYREPNVISNTQFLLRDVAGVKGFPASDKRHWFTYQSGLLNAKGKPKPSYAAYRFPLKVLSHSASSTSLWGYMRFLPNGVSTSAYIQFKPAGASEFHYVGDPVPAGKLGFFEVTEPEGGPGVWRAQFINPYTGGVGGTSPQVAVS